MILRGSVLGYFFCKAVIHIPLGLRQTRSKCCCCLIPVRLQERASSYCDFWLLRVHGCLQGGHAPSYGAEPKIDLLLTRVLGLPQSIETDQRPDMKSRQGFWGAPAAAEGSENKLQVPLLAPRWGVSWFLTWAESRDGSRGQVGGVA